MNGLQNEISQNNLKNDNVELKNNSILSHPALFFIIYIAFAIPTYYLPYVGSNSTFINHLSSAFGLGLSADFWRHVAALYMLVVIAWFRGAAIGRNWLPALPALAGFFDLMPGLNWVPLVPTMFHIVTLIAGITKEPVADSGSNVFRIVLSAIGLIVLVYILSPKSSGTSVEVAENRAQGLNANAIVGVWALAETGCGTGYGAGYTQSGRFSEGDEDSGIEGLWSIRGHELIRQNTLKYKLNETGSSDFSYNIEAIQSTDRFPIILLNHKELYFTGNGQSFSYVKCEDGKRIFRDGEVF